MSEVAHELRQAGDLEKALHYYRKGILLWQGFGHRAAVAHQLECFGFIALEQRKHKRAATLLSIAENLRGLSNSLRTPAEQKEYEESKNKLQAQMTESAFNNAWNEGLAMTMEKAIETALEDSE